MLTVPTYTSHCLSRLLSYPFGQPVADQKSRSSRQHHPHRNINTAGDVFAFPAGCKIFRNFSSLFKPLKSLAKGVTLAGNSAEKAHAGTHVI